MKRPKSNHAQGRQDNSNGVMPCRNSASPCPLSDKEIMCNMSIGYDENYRPVFTKENVRDAVKRLQEECDNLVSYHAGEQMKARIKSIFGTLADEVKG